MLTTLFGAFIAGIFLTFTPCVLPMVPILSSIIAGEGDNISKKKAVSLSLSYVMGTAVTYAIMGAIAGATGEQLQSYFENSWFISGVVIIFVLMALSMFGLFSIQLPSFMQSRLNSQTQNIKGGSLLMVFILGMVSALILGACVSPVLISFLSVAISSGDMILGALTMFFMALGMGVPLIILGFGAGHLLPKAGVWMDKVKYTFGVLLLGVAIYIFSMLELVSPLILWGVFLVATSIYLGSTSSLDNRATGFEKLLKAIGVILLIWGTILLVGGAYGETNLLRPLPKPSISTVTNSTLVNKDKFPFETIDTLDELKSKQKFAKDSHKLLVVFFYSDLCPVCKKMKSTTLIDPKVKERLESNYVAVKVNITDKLDKNSQAIKKNFGIFGPPAFVFFDRDGKLLKDETFYGYQSPQEFDETLEMMDE